MTPCTSCRMTGFHAPLCPAREGNDAINPKHYEHGSGIQTIAVNRCMTFDAGNAFKYVLRHEHKGSPAQDLTKARWYLNDCEMPDDPLFVPHLRPIAAPLLEQMRDWEAVADSASAMVWFLDGWIALDLDMLVSAVETVREGY